jgi:hypothetical protein
MVRKVCHLILFLRWCFLVPPLCLGSQVQANMKRALIIGAGLLATAVTCPAQTYSGCTVTINADKSITIQCPAPPPAVTIDTPLVLPNATDGKLYSVDLSTLAKPTGGVPPYKYAAGSSFPSWLTLSPAGLLSGTPPANTTGPVSITFIVSDSSGTTSRMKGAVFDAKALSTTRAATGR